MNRVARSTKLRKRGLFGGAKKPPDAGEIGARLQRLAGRIVKGSVLDATPRRVTLQLHANASPVRVVVTPAADLEVTFDTGALGPGYAAFVLARLQPVLDELEYAWIETEEDVEAEHLAWLRAQLAGAPPVKIQMPPERTFVVDAPVLTALGPRDASWRGGPDAFAWWEDKPGRAARARALLALWHDVPWRAPIADDEDALFAQVHADLLAAHRADPTIDLPYGAWRALLELADQDTPAAVRATIDAAPIDRTLGYRRYDLEVELPVGWTLRHPAAFTGGWVDDDTRYVATDGERSLELITLTTADATLDSAALLAQSPEHFPVVAREGTARLEREPDGTMHGLVAHAPHVAICTLVGPGAWCEQVWRSLRVT